jgi:hypothetical protein
MICWIRGLFHRPDADTELREEIDFHLPSGQLGINRGGWARKHRGSLPAVVSGT